MTTSSDPSPRCSPSVGNREGLREAVLLGKAWGMTNAYVVNTIVLAAYYFTGLERLDLLDDDIVNTLMPDAQ